MGLDAWITLIVLGSCLGVLIFTRLGADITLVAGLTVLLVTGVVDTQAAFSGFANTGMLTVAVMYIIAAGLRETGALHVIVKYVFGRPRSVKLAQARMMLPTTIMSAFMNNTPVVATFLPAVIDWAKQQRIAISKLAMPLSYAAILGGMCTLIGTSTNLIVHGMLLESTATGGFGFFELAWVGLPCALVGLSYILLANHWLLPNREDGSKMLANAREYTIEMMVAPNSVLSGQTIEAAGLRHLPGLFLIEIERDGRIIAAAAPTEILQEHDRLVFAGVIESVTDLQKMRGLTPATNQIFKLDAPRPQRSLIEVVVSRSSPVAGKSIRAARFRNLYKAVVIA
ncbi:MAG TPA: SLC13 family permease, partial [Gammaproteobacteria bacterium]|nr:SLC13 family permease [Gammaproteobacteria bacterium]